MLELRKILQDKKRGKSDRATARAAGVCRKALKGYLDRLALSNMDFGELLKLDDAQLWELGKPGAGMDTAVEVVDCDLQRCLHILKQHFPTWATRV